MAIIGTAPNKTYQRSDGTRTGSAVCAQEHAAGLNNTKELADARENDFATALNTMLMKDGGNTASGNIPMGGYKITGLGNGTAATDAMAYGQYFPAGTAMLFVQSTAPTGWTKSTTHNDKALRVVSGTASSGGTVAFSTAFASVTPTGTVGGTAITEAQLPAHTHGGTTGGQSADHTHVEYVNGLDQDWGTGVYSDVSGGRSGGGTRASPISTGGASVDHTHSFTTGQTGSGQTHTHSWTGDAINLAVAHLDCIMATKD